MLNECWAGVLTIYQDHHQFMAHASIAHVCDCSAVLAIPSTLHSSHHEQAARSTAVVGIINKGAELAAQAQRLSHSRTVGGQLQLPAARLKKLQERGGRAARGIRLGMKWLE